MSVSVCFFFTKNYIDDNIWRVKKELSSISGLVLLFFVAHLSGDVVFAYFIYLIGTHILLFHSKSPPCDIAHTHTHTFQCIWERRFDHSQSLSSVATFVKTMICKSYSKMSIYVNERISEGMKRSRKRSLVAWASCS